MDKSVFVPGGGVSGLSSVSSLLDPDSAAAAGAAFLDEHVPGWRTRIDLSTLDLESCENCILGQLFDDFMFGLEHLGLVNLPGEATRLGFDIIVRRQDRIIDALNYGRALQAAWERQLGG